MTARCASPGTGARPARAAKRVRLGLHDDHEPLVYDGVQSAEVGPTQALSRYSLRGLFTVMSDDFEEGQEWRTELSDVRCERRGIGLNRALVAVLGFCERQQTPDVQEMNRCVLAPAIYRELYDEIDRLLPHLRYCVSPRQGEQLLAPWSTQALKDSVRIVWEWLDVDRPSRIRMLLSWQGGGGEAFVANVHLRWAQAFRYHGNSLHRAPGRPEEVTNGEFYQALLSRHRLGGTDIGPPGSGPYPWQRVDFLASGARNPPCSPAGTVPSCGGA